MMGVCSQKALMYDVASKTVGVLTRMKIKREVIYKSCELQSIIMIHSVIIYLSKTKLQRTDGVWKN